MDFLRILHICHSLNVGGLERIVVDLAKGFTDKGHYVEICCLEKKEPLGINAEEMGIKVFSLGKRPGISLSMHMRILKMLARGKYHVIHTHNEAGLIYGLPATFFRGVYNTVHTEHGKEPDYKKRKVLQTIEGFLLRRVKNIVAVSDDLKSFIERSFSIDSKSIAVIHNGIDVDYFYRPECCEETKRKLGIDRNSFVIGNISRLVTLKNHIFLFKIFRELIKDYPNLKLVLVGNGPLLNSLKTSSIEMGISSFVIFLGERDDVPQLLSAFDMFILPSLTEGISITLLEAMASGTPVVASDVGGNPEIIKNERTGFLIALHETDKWIFSIRSIIEDFNKRKQISEAGRKFVRERFSLTGMLKQYEKIYKQ